MKANELMIGDWVNETIVGTHQWMMTDYPDFDERFVFPIPLTAEILEKNFGRVKNVCDGYDEWTIEIEPNSSWWLLSITKEVDEGYEYNIDSFPIHYVHELQRALRLCGLNELADNFKV